MPIRPEDTIIPLSILHTRFSSDDLRTIREILKKKPTEPNLTSSELGTALRRLCTSALIEPKDGRAWHGLLTTVHNILDYLDESEHGLEQIQKRNTAARVGPTAKPGQIGNSALELAINSLLHYAKQLAPTSDPSISQLQFISMFDMICRICARLEPKHYDDCIDLINGYSAPEYLLNPELLEIKSLASDVSIIPTIELCVGALKFLFECFRLHYETKKLYRNACSEELELYANDLNPIILLTSHYEVYIPAFFENYGAQLRDAGYGLVGTELPYGCSADAYINRDPKVNTAHRYGMVAIAARSIQKIKLLQKTLRKAGEKGLKIVPMDIVPETLIANIAVGNLIMLFASKFGLIDLLNQYRELSMLSVIKTVCFSEKTKPILINGLEHYKGLNMACLSKGITPKFVIVTSDLDTLSKQTELYRTKFTVAELLDTSKGPAKAVVVDLNDPPKDLIAHLGLAKASGVLAKFGVR